jgi:hypothetical protein
VLVVAGSDTDVVALQSYRARQFAALSTGRLTDRSANTIDFNMNRLGIADIYHCYALASPNTVTP